MRRCDGSRTGHMVTVITGWLESSQTRGSSSSVVTIVPVSARGAISSYQPPFSPGLISPPTSASSSCHPTQSLASSVFCGVPWHPVTTDYVPVVVTMVPDTGRKRAVSGAWSVSSPVSTPPPPLIRLGTWTIITGKAAAMAFSDN